MAYKSIYYKPERYDVLIIKSPAAVIDYHLNRFTYI